MWAFLVDSNRVIEQIKGSSVSILKKLPLTRRKEFVSP